MVAISGMLDTDFVPVTRASYLKVNIRALGTWLGSKSFNRKQLRSLSREFDVGDGDEEEVGAVNC
jgi:hypothetical protein